MKIFTYLVAGALALGVLVAAPCAQAGDEAGPHAEMKRMKAVFAGMTKLVGDVRLTEADAQALILHGPSFTAVGKDEQGDDIFEKLLEARYRKDGVYDFELVLADKRLIAWAAKTKVEARPWLRRYMRAHLVFMRDDLVKQAKQMRADLKEQLAELESMRAHMGEEAYQAAKAAMSMATTVAAAMDGMAAGIPAPDEAEKKVLAKHGKKLRAALDLDDDDEDDEDDSEDEDDESGDDD